MTNFKHDIRQVNQDFCSSYFAMYMNGEWGIEVGYNVIPPEISTMNKELMEWQLNSDCCALCNKSTLSQPFTITAYAVLSPNPCYPLVPLFAGRQQCPCFVNQLLNIQTNHGTCLN